MIFLRITGPHTYLDVIQLWYETAFPADERRCFDDVRRLLSCPDMHLCALINQDQLVGFMIYWQWPDVGVLFIEHFAIDPDRRGQRFGEQAIDYVKRVANASIVLEVELPTDTLSQRRIRFYERLEFSLNTYAYAQPPYERGNPAIPMKLMSIPAIASQNNFDGFSQVIKERVYERFYK